MKTKFLKASFLAIITLFIASCKQDSPSPSSSDLGSFQGNMSVVDDPQTQLGYVYNTTVLVSATGSDAIIKVVGDLGFDREYQGTVTSQISGTYLINLNKQTKPQEKIAGGTVIILDNKLTLDVSIANDNVTVLTSPTAVQSIQITGKLRIIGTDLLKQ